MRLIDADALKAYVNSLSTHPLNEWDTLGVLAAIDKQPTIPATRWHRVEDELPPMLYQAESDDYCIDYSLLVLVYREASHDFWLARQMDDGHGATWGTDCFDELYGVTHWMPLPEPPQEDA